MTELNDIIGGSGRKSDIYDKRIDRANFISEEIFYLFIGNLVIYHNDLNSNKINPLFLGWWLSQNFFY